MHIGLLHNRNKAFSEFILNMSSNLSYEEAMGISNTNPHSQFTQCSSRKHIKLMPKYLGNVRSGVVQQLDSEVFVYNKELGGVPVAYSNIRLVQNMGIIRADQACIHFDIMADFVLFKPQIGCNLSGVVNKVGRQHLGCLVHGKFNAWIPWCDPERQSDNLIGLEIEFTVTNIFTNNNILSLKGTLIEESLQSSKKKKRKNAHSNLKTIEIPTFDSQVPSPSQFDNGPSLCSTRIEEKTPKQQRKKKRKKDKKSLGDSLSETVTESQGDELTSQKPKKKKRKKHISGDSLSETFTESPVSEIASGTSKRKRHKKNKDSAGNSVSENTPETTTSEITSDVHVQKKKKKHSLGDSFSETVTQTKVSESLLPERKKKKKKKKKHSLDSSLNETFDERSFEESEQKKRKKHKVDSSLNETFDERSFEEPQQKKGKKHKLDSSLNETFDERSFEEPQQKKRKEDSLENSLYDAQLETIVTEKISDKPVKKKKRTKHSLSEVVSESANHSDKHAGHESDEGYHSKKAKKKHKR